jgi:hypothetical protein
MSTPFVNIEKISVVSHAPSAHGAGAWCGNPGKESSAPHHADAQAHR